MHDRTNTLRILLLADSHLGFDHPVRPKVRRRRRGLDFLANYERVLRTAIDERVDLVVHGGDVFHRPNVPPSLVYQAFDPLKVVADAGIPVFLVPGNHERSRIPFDWLTRHRGIHVFQDAETVRTSLRGARVAVSGIPCVRKNVRSRFREALARTSWEDEPAELRLLVLHQAFEGAVVGPSDFTFRRGHDVVKLAEVPEGFAGVLAGHIHRSQVLERGLDGHPCPVRVFYPGSLERTAFAERHEPKGFLLLACEPGPGGGAITGWSFRDLDARPMLVRPLRVGGRSPDEIDRELRSVVADAPPDAVLRLEADADPEPGGERVLSAAHLRAVAPESMNVDVVVPGRREWWGRDRRAAAEGRGTRRPDVTGTGPSTQRSLF